MTPWAREETEFMLVTFSGPGILSSGSPQVLGHDWVHYVLSLGLVKQEMLPALKAESSLCKADRGAHMVWRITSTFQRET